MVSNTSSVNLFADDVLLYHVISSTADYATLQEKVNCIKLSTGQPVANYLYLHPLKCKYNMSLIVSHKKMPTLSENPLQLLGSELERVDCYKYLGVLLTCYLYWSSHISNNNYALYGTPCTGPPLQTVLWINPACQVWDPH